MVVDAGRIGNRAPVPNRENFLMPSFSSASVRDRDSIAYWRAFMRAWLRDPLSTAAMSPSGAQLAAMMVAQLPEDAGSASYPVIELGAGTGVFTAALLAAGIAPERLLVIELDRGLHRILRKRFPHVAVECANACSLPEIAARRGIPAHSVGAIVSGLGLLSMPRSAVTRVLEASTHLLADAGRLVQFTYGPLSPVPRDLALRLGLTPRRCGLAWRNMPPATVYCYQRTASSASGKGH